MRAWSRRQLYSFFSSLGTLLGHRLATAILFVALFAMAVRVPTDGADALLAPDHLSGLDVHALQVGVEGTQTLLVMVFVVEVLDDHHLAHLVAQVEGSAVGIGPG